MTIQQTTRYYKINDLMPACKAGLSTSILFSAVFLLSLLLCLDLGRLR